MNDRKPTGFWKREALRHEQSLLRHRVLLNEPHLTKVYTMALSNWVKHTFDQDWGEAPHDYQERYIGWFMSKHLEKEYWEGERTAKVAR
jgi:hypothetical protein